MSDSEACLEGGGAAILDEAYCRRALSQSDLATVERAALLVARAGALANLRETQAALAEVSHALSLNPASATAYFLRGLLRSDNAAALADMDQAIALNPYFIAALAQRGKVHFQHGRFGLAAADFDRALAIQPRSSAALFFKGVLFFHQSEFVQAAALFARVLSLSPVQHPMAVLWRAMSVARGGGDAAATVQAYVWWWEDGAWPSPLVQLWSRNMEPLAAAAAIMVQDGPVRAQGAFFLGQGYLARGNAASARHWLAETRRHGTPGMLEVIVAGPSISD